MDEGVLRGRNGRLPRGWACTAATGACAWAKQAAETYRRDTTIEQAGLGENWRKGGTTRWAVEPRAAGRRSRPPTRRHRGTTGLRMARLLLAPAATEIAGHSSWRFVVQWLPTMKLESAMTQWAGTLWPWFPGVRPTLFVAARAGQAARARFPVNSPLSPRPDPLPMHQWEGRCPGIEGQRPIPRGGGTPALGVVAIAESRPS